MVMNINCTMNMDSHEPLNEKKCLFTKKPSQELQMVDFLERTTKARSLFSESVI